MTYVTRPQWSRFFPKDEGHSMMLTVAISAALGIIPVLLSVDVFKQYGGALFCGVPVALGVLAPALHGIGARRSFGSLLATAMLAQVALFVGILVFAIEGIVCVIIAA